MLALSAVFAVVISTISMPGDRALGQTMTNQMKVQDALDALADALPDPDLNVAANTGVTPEYPGGIITQLQAAVGAIPQGTGTAGIQPDADNDGTADVDDQNAALPNFAITVEIDNPDSTTDPKAKATITALAALTDAATDTAGTGITASAGLNDYLTDLSAARGPVGTDGTEAFELAAANTAFTALRGMLWDSDSDANTDALALSDATKSTLDGLNNGLLTSTPADLAAFKTSVEDALKNDGNWYPDDPATALPTANVADSAGNAVVIADQLNALFNDQGNTDATDDTGAVHDLSDARTAESTALAGAKAILEAVKMAVDDATLPAIDMAIYTPVSPRTTEAEEKAEADKQLAAAKTLLAGLVSRLNASNAEEFTALDEVVALRTALTGVGVPSGGVTMKRVNAAETALLKDNTVNLGVTDTEPDGEPEIGAGEIMNLQDDSLNHIIGTDGALTKLSDLDGTDAQKAAISDLDALLTAVDNAVTKTMFTETTAADLSTEATAVSDALAAFAAVKSALVAKHVNPGDVDDAVTALNTIADTDVGTSLNATIETAATTLSTSLLPDDTSDPTSTVDESALFTALKSSILADALPETAVDETQAGNDPEVTAAELSMALGLTRTDPTAADAATNPTSDDTLATDDFAAFLNNVAMLEDIIDMVDSDPGTTGNQGGTTAFDTLITDLEATVVDAVDTSTGGSLVAANIAAEGFRTTTLEYDDFSAMAALQDALNDLEAAGGDLDDEVRVVREALIAAYDNRDGLNEDAQAEVETAYQELITKGSTQHAFAQKAALLEVKNALETADDDSDALATAIQNALNTQSPEQQQAQAMISRIEPAIRGVTVSGGDKVKLEVKIYGLQDVMDQKLAYGPDGKSGTADDVTFDWGEASNDTGPMIEYTAPGSPGRHTVTVSLDTNECYHDTSEVQEDKCSAEFVVQVRRPSAAQPEDPAPVNPPGDIPELLADDGGNQYAVFTPEEGGTFSGEGYSITAAAGAVPNNEFIGVRMSDDGAASNVGMTHQRYTLGGNMYGVHAVDSSAQAVSSYSLDDPATVCVPLPDELRQDISDLAVVAINSDGSLTILSAQVRISDAGTMVCGGLSSLPASVAVGSAGAPAAIPTATPEPTPVAPETGGTAPASSTMVLWALMLGIAVLTLGSALVISRRREGSRTR